jgi:hypothetical protein
MRWVRTINNFGEVKPLESTTTQFRVNQQYSLVLLQPKAHATSNSFILPSSRSIDPHPNREDPFPVQIPIVEATVLHHPCTLTLREYQSSLPAVKLGELPTTEFSLLPLSRLQFICSANSSIF